MRILNHRSSFKIKFILPMTLTDDRKIIKEACLTPKHPSVRYTHSPGLSYRGAVTRRSLTAPAPTPAPTGRVDTCRRPRTLRDPGTCRDLVSSRIQHPQRAVRRHPWGRRHGASPAPAPALLAHASQDAPPLTPA